MQICRDEYGVRKVKPRMPFLEKLSIETQTPPNFTFIILSEHCTKLT